MSFYGHGLPPQTIRAQVRAYRVRNEIAILRELADLLSLPNVASDRANIEKNADHIISMLQRRGIETKRLQLDGSPSVVYGELLTPGAKRTIILYAHYDGQPVDPAQWASYPWDPVLRDNPWEQGGQQIPWTSAQGSINSQWRLYARSASDDKAPIVAMLAALDALRASGIPLSVNVKFFFEGEEEAGSPHLPDLIHKYAHWLKADAWILCDGPVHQTRRMQVYFGARGITDLEMTVYGPNRALHSGHYGNWAPNPIMLLVHLLASMRDADGHIRIAGFYDDVRPLTDTERRALAEMPDVDSELRSSLALGWTEGAGQRLVEQIMLPAMNLRGIQAGHIGAKAANAISTEAQASFDFRLVPDQTPDSVRSRVEEHIRQQGYFIVHDTPDMETRRTHRNVVKLEWGTGYPAARTLIDRPVSQAVIHAIEEAVGAPIIIMPSLGGSVPMYLFSDVLKTPVIGVPIVNHDNNQHAANENLRIQNLWDGIEVFAHLLARLGDQWP
jgi:acetylornithine deacetylase/succinyl-diaminopimelate desuccinylase-like protein